LLLPFLDYISDPISPTLLRKKRLSDTLSLNKRVRNPTRREEQRFWTERERDDQNFLNNALVEERRRRRSKKVLLLS